MVVADSNYVGSLLSPFKNDAPLIINSDRVVALQITFQCFESISRWNFQIIQFPCTVQLNQFPQCDTSNRIETSISFFAKQLLGICVAKRLNHLL